MWRRAVTLIALPLALSSCSRPEQASTRLIAADEDRVIGVAVLRASGDGTVAAINVSDLEPETDVHGAINAGNCAEPGASVLALEAIHTDHDGRGRTSGRLLFRGREDVALSDLADGEHVVRLFMDDADVACGRIPRL